MHNALNVTTITAPLAPKLLADATATLPTGQAQVLSPVPVNAPRPNFRHARWGQPSGKWAYHGKDGSVLGYVCRWPRPGEKEILPLTLWSSDDTPKWQWRSWARPRPLFGLDQLTRRPGAPVLVVEGEKAATGLDGCSGAAALLRGWVVMTSPGGAESAQHADWSPLAGRDVCIWPDADAAGLTYAKAVARLVDNAGANSVRMVSTIDLHAGFDLGDPIPHGVDVEARIRDAVDGRTYHISVGRFEMCEAGLFLRSECDEDPDAEPAGDILVSSPFEILGRARDPDGHGWGKWLRWRDPDGRTHEHYLADAAVHGDIRTVAGDLAARGLMIAYRHRPHLAEYLNTVDVPHRITRVARTGWHRLGDREVFVLPNAAIGAASTEKIVLAGAADAPYGSRASLSEWRAGVGQLAAGHERLMLAISAGFAGPLLHILDIEGGGLHFFGASSKGKTTMLQAAASVWGRGASNPGFVRSWRATANAQEGTAALMSDTLLPLDEIGVADAKEASTLVYQLTAGVGKGKMRRDASLRPALTWRVLVVSTGETPMATKIEERGGRAFAGQGVRLLDIPADAEHGHGVFNHAGSEGEASRLADRLKAAATSAYGTAGPAFVEHLLQAGLDSVMPCLSEMISAFVESHVPGEADGQVKRAAARLALIGAAGELAREWNIVPWNEGAAMESAATALRAWVGLRGGHEPAEVHEAIRRVRAFIEAHGESRFEPIERDARVIHDRYGFRRHSGDDVEWLIFPERWSELCAGLNPTEVARALWERGMLKRDCTGKKFSRSERTSYGTKRVYVVTGAILSRDPADDRQDDDDHADHDA
jgi:uncharacterized protein (DUF927 family)